MTLNWFFKTIGECSQQASAVPDVFEHDAIASLDCTAADIDLDIDINNDHATLEHSAASVELPEVGLGAQHS